MKNGACHDANKGDMLDPPKQAQSDESNEFGTLKPWSRRYSARPVLGTMVCDEYRRRHPSR